MSTAIELFKNVDGEFKPTGVFCCSECRAVFPNEAQAQSCHGERPCHCGKKIERRFYVECDDCRDSKWRKEQAEKELQRYQTAKKVPYADYSGGMLFNPHSNKFFRDEEEMEDHYFDAPTPGYVWACEDVGVPKANSDSIVETLLDGMWEDADHNASGDVPHSMFVERAPSLAAIGSKEGQ